MPTCTTKLFIFPTWMKEIINFRSFWCTSLTHYFSWLVIAYKVQYAIKMEVLPCIYEKIKKIQPSPTLRTIFYFIFSRFGYYVCTNRKETRLPFNYLLGIFTKVFQASGWMRIIKTMINYFLWEIKKWWFSRL
jgi:hypothetical protein